MKKLLRTYCLALTAGLLASTAVSAQVNLITNGDFENRNQAPQAFDNIAPQPAGKDDLTDWVRTNHNGSNHPGYIALDGVKTANPQSIWDWYLQQYKLDFSFKPHSGQSCVLLTQHDAPADHYYNSMITHELRTPLLPGHTYEAGFWALRSVSGRFRTSLALWVTDDVPSYDYPKGIITPHIGTKIVESPDDILDMQNWTYVHGTITIPEGETHNKWVTVGYDPQADQYYDSDIKELIPPPNHVSFIEYAIDDISLVDVTCTAVPVPAIRRYYYNNCGRTASYQITNYNPAYNYVVNLYGSFMATTLQPNSNLFTITGAPNGRGGTFTVTTTIPYCDGSATTDPIRINFIPCEESVVRGSTAYPNPAAESITMPAGVESATLLNDKGRAVQQLTPGSKMDVQSLPDGLYNLQIMQDGKLINQRIQVKH